MLFSHDTATTEIYTLSLHDALPISAPRDEPADEFEYDPNDPAPTIGGTTFLPGLHLAANSGPRDQAPLLRRRDRKSTRLNSSHSSISYAVFCLKKKKKHPKNHN